MTSLSGNTSSMYASPGPQAGTRSGGNDCNHRWRIAIAAPAAAASAATTPYTLRPLRERGACTAPIANTSARAMNATRRSEEHTSELQSLMRTSYAVFCLKKHKGMATTAMSIHIEQTHLQLSVNI